MDKIQYKAFLSEGGSSVSSWIMTASGRAVYPCAPRAEDIDINDIAHALSHLCRFGGHSAEFYSVAQHSVLVSRECPGYELEALLHDAAEAFLGDVPRPLKRSNAFGGYVAAEAHLQAVILRRFGIIPEPESVATIALADRRMLRTEQRDLMPPPAEGEDRQDVEPYSYHIRPWSVRRSRQRFLRRFMELT